MCCRFFSMCNNYSNIDCTLLSMHSGLKDLQSLLEIWVREKWRCVLILFLLTPYFKVIVKYLARLQGNNILTCRDILTLTRTWKMNYS